MKTILTTGMPFRFTKNASGKLILLQGINSLFWRHKLCLLTTESLGHKTRMNQKSKNQDFHTQ